MTRAKQSHAVANERQDDSFAIAGAEDHTGTEERLNRRAGAAALGRDRAGEDAELPTICRALAEARRVKRLEDHIRRVIDEAPPLTAEQRDKLALLLRRSRV